MNNPKPDTIELPKQRHAPSKPWHRKPLKSNSMTPKRAAEILNDPRLIEQCVRERLEANRCWNRFARQYAKRTIKTKKIRAEVVHLLRSVVGSKA